MLGVEVLKNRRCWWRRLSEYRSKEGMSEVEERFPVGGEIVGNLICRNRNLN